MRHVLAMLVVGMVVGSCSPLAVPRVPIPPPKRSQPRFWVPGKYTVYWCGSPWKTTFYGDGGYVAEKDNGLRYEGGWEKRGDTLVIVERLAQGNSPPSRYEHVLVKGGLQTADGSFRMVPLR